MSRSDALVCRRITRAHARTFSLASYFLPAPKRRAAFALYAFCRVADDIVDRATGTGASAAGELDAYRRRLDAALAGRPDDAVLRELARVVREYGVPAAPLHQLLDGVARDLEPVRYATWEELERYCAAVASTVGEACTWIFGVPHGDAARTQALVHARTLGVAMQLTNILRDVGEDAARGRCYLPDEVLARFGLAADDVVARRVDPRDERWRAMMAHEIARARSLYAAAAPGIVLLSADARRCVTACAEGYASSLGAIELTGLDSLSARARVGVWGRAATLWKTLRPRGASPAPATSSEAIRWA